MSSAAASQGYHAHIYFDAGSRDRAARLREALDLRFDVVLGRWRETPVGPHPRSMYQAAFAPEIFDRVVPWLMLNREGLAILVHPETGDALYDHTKGALWMGEMLPINEEFLRRGGREA